MRPKLAPAFNEAVGLLKFTRLNTLNTSVRNCNRPPAFATRYKILEQPDVGIHRSGAAQDISARIAITANRWRLKCRCVKPTPYLIVTGTIGVEIRIAD